MTTAFMKTLFDYNERRDDTVADAYVELRIDGSPALGVAATQDADSSWMAYFAVENADAAVARALAAGGSITRPAESTPYGRIATITDPEGATSSVIAS